jgi:hypothetical protein
MAGDIGVRGHTSQLVSMRPEGRLIVEAVKFAEDSKDDEHELVPQQLTAVGYLEYLSFSRE